MTVRLIIGDCREVLPTLPAESVHCVVTSPPYWGLRDYGTAQWQGGDPTCNHVAKMSRQDWNRETPGGRGGSFRTSAMFARNTCYCGARRIDAQLGLEPTPAEYVTNLVAMFRKVRRVLRRDGTAWLVLGDSYATGAGRVGVHPGGGKQGERWHGEGSKHDLNKGNGIGPMTQPNRMPLPGLKPKDLVGIPWRVAFALQGDGWWLRQDIIWSKPNPMPESVTDRCTKAHEYIFLLTKAERYFYDAEAIAEAAIEAGRIVNYDGTQKNCASGDLVNDRRTLITRPTAVASTRNRRSVWTVATSSYPEAHFATFPPTLVEPCILAGCPAGGVVLDPFAGAGTVGLVADRLQRDAILIELNPAYVEMGARRVRADAPLFANVEVPL